MYLELINVLYFCEWMQETKRLEGFQKKKENTFFKKNPKCKRGGFFNIYYTCVGCDVCLCELKGEIILSDRSH